MTKITTRERALNWWKSLDFNYKSILILKYIHDWSKPTDNIVTDREIEELYTKVNHN